MTRYTARFFRDIERCPFVPSEPGYDAWMEKDQQRLKELEEKRQRILRHAKLMQATSQSPLIIEVAEFIIEQLDREL